MDKKPYLIRAIYDWCIDNGFTPYILSLIGNRTIVPEALSGSNEIVLNLSPQSIKNLFIDDDGVSFKGRFNGSTHDIFIPVNSVLGVYAKENGDGIFFNDHKELTPNNRVRSSGESIVKKTKPRLSIVK